MVKSFNLKRHSLNMVNQRLPISIPLSLNGEKLEKQSFSAVFRCVKMMSLTVNQQNSEVGQVKKCPLFGHFIPLKRQENPPRSSHKANGIQGFSLRRFVAKYFSQIRNCFPEKYRIKLSHISYSSAFGATIANRTGITVTVSNIIVPNEIKSHCPVPNN